VTDVAHQIMNGAAYLYRVQGLKTQGILFAPSYEDYTPQALA
jgi:hypothetical protein